MAASYRRPGGLPIGRPAETVKEKRGRQAGLTVLELLIVAGILGIVALLVVASTQGSLTYTGDVLEAVEHRDVARDTLRRMTDLLRNGSTLSPSWSPDEGETESSLAFEPVTGSTSTGALIYGVQHLLKTEADDLEGVPDGSLKVVLAVSGEEEVALARGVRRLEFTRTGQRVDIVLEFLPDEDDTTNPQTLFTASTILNN